MKQTRPTCPQGPDVKKEHNAEVPKTMAGQFFRIVQVVAPGAAPSFVLLPTALVRTMDTTQTLPETVRPIRLQGPDDTVDTKTDDRTQKVTDAGVTKTDDRTQTLPDAGVNRTQTLPDAGVDRTQNSTDAGVDGTQNSTDAGVDKTQNSTDAGVDKTDDTTQNSTGESCKMLARFGGKRRRKNTCTSPVKNNISQFPALKDYLPASCNNTSYDYHVCHYQTISETSDHINFRATLRMALSSEDEIKLWLKSHTVTWRVERSRKSKGDRVLFKVDYRCQHNTKHNPKPENISVGGRNTTSKNTNCPAKMTVTILRTRTKVSRGRPSVSSDPHVPAFPTMLSICSEHNHNINGTDALRYRDVGDKAREKLLKLFEAGHNPSAALEVLKIDLQVEHGENYAAAVENKELCPTLEFCYRLRHKLFGKLRSTHRRGSSLPGSQKKRRKKKVCPEVQQCVTAEKEQTDDLMQGQSSQQNPSQGDPGTNQEECEAESAADFLCLSVSNDYEEDTEDLVETMIRDLSSLRKDPMYSQAIAAMAKQFHHIRSNRSRLLSSMHCFGKGQTSSIRTATRRPDALSPCQPTVTPHPVTKLSSKRRLPSGPQQTHSSPIKRPRMMDYHI